MESSDLGEVVATFGWSLASRATLVGVGLSALAFGLGWCAWEYRDYGSVSAGAIVLFALGSLISIPFVTAGLSGIGQTPLVLRERGLESSIHRRYSRCLYSDIVDVVHFRFRSADYFALALGDGNVLRIERIRRRDEAIAEIERRIALGRRPGSRPSAPRGQL